MTNETVTEIAAQDNFYLHVNNKWLTSEDGRIPAEYSRWGGFTKLHDTGLKKQIELVRELVSTSGQTEEVDNIPSEENKIVAIWNASTNLFHAWQTNDCSTANLSAVTEQFNQLDELFSTKNSYPVLLAGLFKHTFENDISNVLAFDKGSDMKNSNNVLLDVTITGLSMPSRDYYLEPSFEEQRQGFLLHLSNVRDIINRAHFSVSHGNCAARTRVPNPLSEEWPNQVMQFETELARYMMKPSQRREYDKYYTTTTLTDFYGSINSLNSLESKEENYSGNDRGFRLDASQILRAGIFLETLYDHLNFRRVLRENARKYYDANSAAKPNEEGIVCYDGDGLRRVISMILSPDKKELYKAYLQYKILSSFEAETTKELNCEFFEFYGRKLSGQSEQKPYEKRSIALVNDYAGELLGKLFVERYFPEECKARMLKLINAILEMMRLSLKRNDWMTEGTKVKALEKLSLFRVKIGYPDKWKEFSDLHIQNGDTLSQIRVEVLKWSKQHEFYDKINAPLDWTEWLMSPQTVNAYFMPTQNEIVFPAAILQPPFFHRDTSTIDFDISEERAMLELDDDFLLTAVNLGGIGSVIAHEITHGYDDKGRKFDGKGNLVDWWDSRDAELFNEKTRSMDKQARNYKINIDEVEYSVDPALTMGENLADLGGMSLSIQALQNILAASVHKDNMKPYFRVFFKSWANVWKQNSKKEYRLRALKTDPHAPTEFRANLVKNINQFHDAFDVTEQDRMFLPVEERLCMW